MNIRACAALLRSGPIWGNPVRADAVEALHATGFEFSGVTGTAEKVPQRLFQPGVPEVVVGADQLAGPDPLARLSKFACSFAAEQQPSGRARYREESGATQYAGQYLGVVGVAHRVWCGRVDRAGEHRVEYRPVVDADQVVDADPGHPLLAAAEAAAEPSDEQGPQQPQGPAAG